jgi:hypothetical protein
MDNLPVRKKAAATYSRHCASRVADMRSYEFLVPIAFTAAVLRLWLTVDYAVM